MKKIIFILMLAIGLGSFSCNKEQIEERPVFSLETPDLVDDENYEIYSLVINEVSHGWVVIDQSSLTNLSFSDSASIDISFFENNPDFNSSLFDTLNYLSESIISFGENFVCEYVDITLVSSKELSYIFDNKDYGAGWKEFYQEYSGDLLRFTQIAYNEEKTQSILVCEQSDYLSTARYFVYLLQQNDNWMVEDYDFQVLTSSY